MKSPIINIASIELKPMPTVMEPTGAAAERFGARMGFISNPIGGKQLGYNITAIPKGKRAFPFHNHQVNEQMFFVLAGHGEIRIGDGAFLSRKAISSPALREAKRLLIRSSTPMKRNCAFWLLAPSYRLKSLNIPIQTALACSQVSRQMKPEGRAQ
jgi:hypothetical protein